MVGAGKTGERLLGEVEEMQLGELLSELRGLCRGGGVEEEEEGWWSGIPEWDDLVGSTRRPRHEQDGMGNQPQPQSRDEGFEQVGVQQDDDLWLPPPNQNQPGVELPRQQQPSSPQQPSPTRPQVEEKRVSSSSPPIVEILSPPHAHHPSGAGKTSLIYLLTAQAILPSTLPGARLRGKNAAVLIFDPLSHFDVGRLVEVMLDIIRTALKPSPTSTDTTPQLETKILTAVKTALHHVHIFRPQSWASLIATLEQLPDYLFDKTGTRHKSMGRRVSMLVVEDLDVWVWSLRSPFSTAASLGTIHEPNPLVAAGKCLTAHLTSLSSFLSSAVIVTSTSASAFHFSSHPGRTPELQYRPLIPLPWSKDVSFTRLAVRRIDVVPFKPLISLEEAEGERGKRWNVVRRGRFECWKVGGSGREREREGFVFRITDQGVGFESGDERP